MVAGVIGEIGLLGRMQMERFPELFLALQTEGSARDHNSESYREAQELLNPFRSTAKTQISAAGGFLIKCAPRSPLPSSLAD